MSYKHIKVTDYIIKNGGTEIVNKSYYEDLDFYKRELQQERETSSGTLLADIMAITGIIKKDNSPELTLTIYAPNGLPEKIVYKWTIEKQKKNRR